MSVILLQRGSFRMFDSLALNNRYGIIEGLVVDTINGGIAFRNHTIPTGLSQGGTWKEDLLWVTPDTECVNMNLTLEFVMRGELGGPGHYVTLRDNGGFKNLVKDYQYIDLNDTQARPTLAGRAWKAASFNNLLLMRYLNLTRTGVIPETFNMTGELGKARLDPYQLRMHDTGLNPLPGLPFNDELDTGKPRCHCGRIWRCRHRQHQPYRSESGSLDGHGQPSRQQHCGFDTARIQHELEATALRLRLRTEGFGARGDLRRQRQFHLRHPSHGRFQNSPSETLGSGRQRVCHRQHRPNVGTSLGRVGGRTGLSILRSDRLYLPAGAGGTFSSGISYQPDAMAGTHGLLTVLSETYTKVLTVGALSAPEYLPDYTDFVSYPMYTRWQNLSKSTESATLIFNLLWTDIAASLVTGSKPHLASSSTASADPSRPVLVFERRIKYDLRYAIPAMLFAALWLVLGIAFLLVLLFAGTRVAHITQLLNHTATGRVVTNIVAPDMAPPGAPTKEWAKSAGVMSFRLESEKVAVERVEGCLPAKGS
ncbi:hypothetical protein BZA05DRAFT_174896 [Tricharina praecox]|uniref:uncharacterized protein n=1 Tax=Tricharina praecox TaxID=43433 RepID=UPI00221EC5DA|nr:uncharacterized protein BZA05DRAFT_192511 [Tricharina praecox]XP_051335724.1 uncharacterized protein BZA05DRAFT_174896 [Tricharina praecox]KAI5842735.1 hypothetical protein BZA05DRAFT_192511 [Tricharina praecox]KAI5844075.1 hypothetical protein BZA05DRAFT_174896 [Tricharina praecox]